MYNYTHLIFKDTFEYSFTSCTNWYIMDELSRATGKEVMKMIKAGIIGATGYAGGELVRLLTAHKNA